MKLTCFSPVASESARILILGSMPGKKSLEMNQYYAHPRNLFWPIMAEILGFDIELDYQSRTLKLIENHIALWDVLQHCHREGSLDNNIRNDSIVCNDFAAFFAQHKDIRSVFFNGRKAQNVYNRMVLPEINDRLASLDYQVLPSTSPANASIPRKIKLKQWQQIMS